VKITAVMCVRDEADLIAPVIRYHRDLFADEVLVVDNGSVDWTRDVLAETSRSDPAVRWRLDDGPYAQDVILSGLAREAHAGGADWVVPVDADELWWSPGDLRDVLADTPDGVGALACRVVNFVQDRSVVERRPRHLLSMRWRAEVLGTEDESPDMVRAGEISYLEMYYPPKHVLRPTKDVIIHVGNHHVDLVDGELDETDELSVLHAPVRSRSFLAERAVRGRRANAEKPDLSVSWHLRRVAQLELEGRLDEEWRACSVADGALDVGDRRHPVVADDRLVRAIRPHLGTKQRLLHRIGR
jgi:glycosyltransferase involved in cell wall biosynthesis